MSWSVKSLLMSSVCASLSNGNHREASSPTVLNKSSMTCKTVGCDLEDGVEIVNYNSRDGLEML